MRFDALPYKDLLKIPAPEVASFVLKTAYTDSENVPMKLVDAVPVKC
jgi:hypothetical protein